MVIARAAVALLFLISLTSARPAALKRMFGRRSFPFSVDPGKIKRQTDDTHPSFAAMDQLNYGVPFSEQYSSETHSDESMVRIRKQASVAEVFRHRLMACGLITTKSPERWRDRLIAELDEIISEIEQRCAVCNSLYEEPCRYEMLRSLIDPCPACRRKNTKKRLLLTLQKVLEKALDGKPEAAESGVVHEDEPNDANIWPITDIPKSRKTRSTTEIPLDLTTTVYGNTREEANHAAIHNYKLKTPSWWSHHEHTTGTVNLSDKTVEPIPSVNCTGVNEDAPEPTVAQVINGQRVDNIHDFLQQYMNLVYGGHPGNEQRKQFFLDQLCRNATNGTIVLQCKDNGGQRKARSPAPAATKKVSARNVGEDSNAPGDVQKSILFTTPSLNELGHGGSVCYSRWSLGTKRRQWLGDK